MFLVVDSFGFLSLSYGALVEKERILEKYGLSGDFDSTAQAMTRTTMATECAGRQGDVYG